MVSIERLSITNTVKKKYRLDGSFFFKLCNAEVSMLPFILGCHCCPLDWVISLISVTVTTFKGGYTL